VTLHAEPTEDPMTDERMASAELLISVTAVV
jgi:hypothetical protein